MSSFYFVIVGHNDNPIFELDHTSKSDGAKGDEKRHMYQFVAHAALDLVDEAKWQTGNLNLKTVDKFSELTVTGFVTASQMRFLLVHDGNLRSSEAIKNFFSDMYELFIKAILNPFYTHDTPIKSPNFKKRAQLLAKKLSHP